MNLDMVASALCGWMALCIFGLHVVSSPRRRRWMTFPEYVRRGFLIGGGMLTWRSVNFARLSPSAWSVPGHINVEGVMAALAVAYIVTSLVVWAYQHSLSGNGWDQVNWVEAQKREDAAKIAVVMTPVEFEAHARAKGL